MVSIRISYSTLSIITWYSTYQPIKEVRSSWESLTNVFYLKLIYYYFRNINTYLPYKLQSDQPSNNFEYNHYIHYDHNQVIEVVPIHQRILDHIISM